MSNFRGETVQANVVQFAPIATPNLNSVTNGALWFDQAGNNFQSLINGVPTPFGTSLGSLSKSVIDASSSVYGMAWDGKQIATATITNGSKNVSSSVPGTFSASDVGKVVYGFSTCNTDAGIGTQGTSIARTTITSFIDSQHITVGVNATATQNNTACLYWGTVDDTGLNAVEAAALASPTCPAILFPAKMALLEKAHFIQAVPTCVNSGPGLGESLIGWGQVVSGWGKGSSILALTPAFDISTCTGGTGTACFGGQKGQHFRGFQVTGGGLGNTAFASSKNIWEMGSYSLAEDMGWYAFGSNDNNAIFFLNGIGEVGFTNSDINSYSSQVKTAAQGQYFLFHSAIQDNCKAVTFLIQAGATVNSFGSFYADGVCAPANQQLIQNLGTFNSYSDTFFTDAFGSLKYLGLVNNGATSVAHLNGTIFAMVQGTSGLCVDNGVSGAITYAQNCTFRGGSADNAIFGVSGTTFVDMGGNKLVSGGVSAPVIGDASILGFATSSNIDLTTGWGTANVNTVSGSSTRMAFTISITGGSPSANPVLTITFPNAFVFGAPISTLVQSGGTFGDITNPSVGTASTTGVVITFSGTPIAGNSYSFVLNSEK